MLRRLAAAAACGLTALALLGAVPTGSLFVTSLPAAADAWIDGTYLGRTPLVADGLAAGRHTVGLAKTGWTSLQVDATVAAGQTSMTSVRLDRAGPMPAAAGSIAIHGVSARSVALDGVPAAAGKDGTFTAPAGPHVLVMRTPRGRVTRSITVWPQMRTDVVVAPDDTPVRPTVVAPAEDYVGKAAIRIDGARVVIRSGGHEAVGKIGETTYRVDGRYVEYDSAPTFIGTRLYLPIELLTLLARKS